MSQQPHETLRPERGWWVDFFSGATSLVQTGTRKDSHDGSYVNIWNQRMPHMGSDVLDRNCKGWPGESRELTACREYTQSFALGQPTLKTSSELYLMAPSYNQIFISHKFGC